MSWYKIIDQIILRTIVIVKLQSIFDFPEENWKNNIAADNIYLYYLVWMSHNMNDYGTIYFLVYVDCIEYNIIYSLHVYVNKLIPIVYSIYTWL